VPFKTTPITELGFNSNPMVDALTRWQIPVSKVADVPNAVRKALAGQPRVAPGRMPPQIRGLCRLGGIVWGIRKSAPLGATPMNSSPQSTHGGPITAPAHRASFEEGSPTESSRGDDRHH